MAAVNNTTKSIETQRSIPLAFLHGAGAEAGGGGGGGTMPLPPPPSIGWSMESISSIPHALQHPTRSQASTAQYLKRLEEASPALPDVNKSAGFPMLRIQSILNSSIES